MEIAYIICNASLYPSESSVRTAFWYALEQEHNAWNRLPIVFADQPPYRNIMFPPYILVYCVDLHGFG